MHMRFNFLLCVLRTMCIVLPLCFVGCSVSDRHVFEDAEGIVPETFFSTVKKDKTEKSWIVDHLGQPQFYIEGPNQEEIYTYHFDHARHRKTSVLVFFRFNGSENEERYYHVVLCDDLVKKAWWDAFEQVQVAKVVKRSGCAEAETKDASMDNIDRIGHTEQVPEKTALTKDDAMQQKMDAMPSMPVMQSARASENASIMMKSIAEPSSSEAASTNVIRAAPKSKMTETSQPPKPGTPVPVLSPVVTEDVVGK